MTKRYAVVVFILMFILSFIIANAQDNKVPAYSPVDSGKSMYVAYCASCHGNDGKGNGPHATGIKVAPPDLTKLSARNGGKFPDAHVFSSIRCARNMPQWGTFFSSLEKHDRGLVQLRLHNLTRYIESLQNGSGS